METLNDRVATALAEAIHATKQTWVAEVRAHAQVTETGEWVIPASLVQQWERERRPYAELSLVERLPAATVAAWYLHIHHTTVQQFAVRTASTTRMPRITGVQKFTPDVIDE